MIELKNITKSYGEKTVLSDFSLTLASGKITALLGASGSGKTTVMRLIGGLEAPDSGKIEVQGEQFSFMFQEDRLLPFATLIKNLEFVGIASDKAKEAINAVGLSGEENNYPENLSGGMKRRLALARALWFPKSTCILLDEPFTGQDENTRRRLIPVVSDALKGKTALLITHNEDDAKDLADIIIRI